MLFEHLGRDVDAKAGKRVRLVVRHAADAGRHPIFRREVLPEHRPFAAAAAHGQIANCRRAGVDRKSRAQLRRALAIPRDSEHVAFERRREAGARFVLREVAVQRSRRLIRGADVRRRRGRHDERGNDRAHSAERQHQLRAFHFRPPEMSG